jgi:small RNA 2'-O-methyltransferase
MIEITSTNPHLSFILEKNPNTQRESKQAFERELRKGRLYGWFPTDAADRFRMLFVDAKTESSFNRQNQQFEYLDRTRYSSSYLPIAAIGTMLAKAMKQRHELDLDGYTNTFSCMIETSNTSLARRMLRNTPEITLEPVNIAGNPAHHLFNMRVETNKSVHHMLNLIQVFCIMQAIEDRNLWIDMRESDVRKYVRSMNIIDAPYYLRYTLTAFGIPSEQVFNAIREELSGDKFVLNFGNTQDHREAGIIPELPGGDLLWDIGCGELRYTRKLCKRYAEIVAFDADPNIQEKNQFRLKNRDINNVTLCGKVVPESFEQFKPGTDILMTEVLEHMPKEDAMELLSAIEALPFRYAIFTVPNKDFNKFYGFTEEDTRHDDHHYEPTENEFKDMLVAAGYGYHRIEFIKVSDAVIDGGKYIPATLCAKVIKP